MSGSGAWMIAPTVYTDDPTKGYGADRRVWIFTYDGGDHCSKRHDSPPWGCALPPDHSGDHMPVVDELLDRGIRAAPAPTSSENE